MDFCDYSDLVRLLDAEIKFGTIYLDPAWPYENKATRGAAEDHYPTMSIEELIELPVKKLASDLGHLHLWTTNAFLFDCPKILEAWGFDYKGVFVWVKPQIGMGNYYRVSHEFLVLGVKGGLRFSRRNQKSWKMLDRLKEHSSKPEEFRQMIETLSPTPRLELFGRKPIFNNDWIVWGNEILRNDFNLMLEGVNAKRENYLLPEYKYRARRQEGYHTLFK